MFWLVFIFYLALLILTLWVLGRVVNWFIKKIKPKTSLGHQKLLTPLGVAILAYSILFLDAHIADFSFDRYCKDTSLVGTFVYERVDLPDSYLLSPSDRVHPGSLDARVRVGNNKLISRERLEMDYIITVYKNVPLSTFGPLTVIETSIIRKSDMKLLSKAVSIKNSMGWLSRLTSFGYASTECPSEQASSSVTDDEHRIHHKTLLHETFFKD